MGVRVCPRGARPAGDGLDFAPVAQAAGVVEQLADGDGLFVGGDFGEVFANVVVESDLFALDEQEDGGGGELLAY